MFWPWPRVCELASRSTLATDPCLGPARPCAETLTVALEEEESVDRLELRLMELLAAGPRNLYDMADVLGLKVQEINSALLTLALKKKVRRLPGQCFERYSPTEDYS